MLKKVDKTVKEVRIALEAVAPELIRAKEAENFLRKQTLTTESVEQAANLALKEAKPLSKNGYKVAIAKALVKRALLGYTATPLFDCHFKILKKF